MTQYQTTRRITQQHLQHIALQYVQQFGGTEQAVRTMLSRHIKKSLQAHPNQDIHTIQQAVDTVVKKLSAYGYINDVLYAQNRIEKLLNRGKSLKHITADLQAKGIAADIIHQQLQTHDSNDTNAHAVQVYVQKRRLGIYRYTDQDDIDTYVQQHQNHNNDCYKQHQKDLAKCAKQGFCYRESTRALLGGITV